MIYKLMYNIFNIIFILFKIKDFIIEDYYKFENINI